MNIVLAANGIVRLRGEGLDWEIEDRSLEDRQVTAVTLQNGTVLAGTTEGIFRSTDGGRSWLPSNSGLTQQHIRWLSSHPKRPGLIFAGAEPAAIYVSTDGGSAWSNRPEVDQLRDRFGWYLPYSPSAGCVRGFTFHGSRAYAAVEVGGLLKSNDSGQSWQLAAASDGVPSFGAPKHHFIHPDVHSVTGHLSSADLIFAPTGGGFYVSEDGGSTFVTRHPPCYVRAVWIDPEDPEHLVLGPASGVDKAGRIKESLDCGANWTPIEEGLDTPWPRHMVERFVSIGDVLLAVLSNGDLFAAVIGRWQWRQIATEAGWVKAAAVIG